MPKIKAEDLEKIRNKVRQSTILREGSGARARVTVHMGTCGIAAGARPVMEALLQEIDAHQVKDVFVMTSGCAGLCSREPMATVELATEVAPVKYVDLTPDKMKRIFEEHVLGGKMVKEYALAVGSERTG
jgi:NADP-reducing hydrogenase subunit HndB